MKASDGTDEPEDDHAYFQAVEEIFVGLRGAPLLLSPADWQVAQRWHQEGVPLDLVRTALDEVFARRKERGTKGKISSLRYCAPAVDKAWEEHRDLAAPGFRGETAAFDLGARLAALAAALPDALAGRESWAGRVAALASIDDPQTVEERLAELDRELLATAGAALCAEARSELVAGVERSLAGLAGRLSAEEAELSRQRLEAQAVRRRERLPLLSLFSPDAEPRQPARDSEAGGKE
jgi:hypothetical protein